MMNDLEADLLHRVRVNTQMTGHDAPLLVQFCEGKGWLRRNLHGCLFLTYDGEKALVDRDRTAP